MLTTLTNSQLAPSVKPVRLLALAAMLVLGFASIPDARSQTVDTSEWVCEYCPFEKGHRGHYSAGVTSVSEDTAYFGDATGYDEEGVYANLDGEGSYASDQHRARWSFSDLGLTSRSAALDGGRPGVFDYTLAYQELPRRQFNTTSTIFRQSGDTLVLPGDWARASLSSGFSGLGASLQAINIEGDRSVFDIGGRYLPHDNWSLTADYRRNDQDGTRILGGSYFTNAALLPASSDSVTDELDVGLRYTGARSVVSLGWYLSDFSNDQSAFNWEHPFTTVPGAEFAALAQAPDSRFQQLTLAAGHAFNSLNAHASFSLAVGTVEQDARFLADTTNANLATSPLARNRLDGDVETTRLGLSFTARPMPKARIKIRYRYDERQNDTARDDWNRVIADSFVSGELETNIPYSFERSSFSASAQYKLFDDVRISAGYDRNDKDYDFQEVAEQNEDTGWGKIRWQAFPTLHVEARGGTSKRDIDGYNEALAAEFGQNPLLRKYNLAYRYRRFGDLSMTWSPLESPVSATLTALYADDDYTKSQLGLKGGEDFRLGADVNWTVAANASVYVNVGFEEISTTQLGSESLGAADWEALIDDDFMTLGGGVVVRGIGEKLDLRLDYLHTDGSSAIRIDSNDSAAQAFPDLSTDFDQLRVRMSYRRSDRLDLDLSLRYQRFKAEDWMLEGVGPATVPRLLTLGAEPYSPENWLFGIGVRYRLGGAGDSE